MSGRLIKEDLFTKFSIVDVNLPEGRKIHEFLSARAKALAGKYIDFDKTPVTFLLSDSDEPNAFYAPAPDPDPENKPRRDDYSTVRYIKNPLETPVICVTRGLIEMADNLDQLDFVLGHELTHMIMRLHKIKQNSKGEEEIADLHSVDLMYDAGADPKQALFMSDKLSAYGEEQAKKQAKKRYRGREEKEEGINWSEIFDVHMTDGNRKAGIEAALTKLSHLIDDKKPASIDKASFDAHYTDPVDAFLKANGYDGKRPLGKLKLLVDCIDHISASVPASDFFAAELAELPEKDQEGYSWRFDDRRENLQKQIDAGYPDYFLGPVIPKKYQQKIASLAEGIVNQVEDERQQRGNPHKPAVINAQDLNLYLQDTAYRHISAHGYPVAGDFNYRAAAGIMYSYFYTLLATNSPRQRRYEGKEADTSNKKRKLPQIEIEIGRAQAKIKSAGTAADFSQAVEEFYKLTDMLHEIRTINYGGSGRGDKLDNLSGLDDFRLGRFKEDVKVYGGLKEGSVIPWGNLVEIAKTDEKTKDSVVKFLKQNGIEDYRITHGLPYVRIGYSDSYRVTDGKLSDEKIEEYELDFAVNRDLVLQAYDYIKTYFGNESSLIGKHCAEAVNIDDKDFEKDETVTDSFNRHSVAQKRIYDFISLFNALPDDNERHHSYDGRSAVALIPERYQVEHLIPGSRKTESGYRDRIVFEFSEKLLGFDNPIFQDHFGETFEAELIAKKEAQQQQMFDTAFVVLKKAIDIWRETQPKRKELEEREKVLSEKLWDDETDEQSKETIREKRDPLHREISFYREKDDQTTSLIFNILFSIFDGESTGINLQRLKPEQKKILTEFAVRDEQDAILPILNPERYEYFCDYLKILENQTNRVISGNYQLTDMMQVVARKYGYQSATDKETLAAFVENNRTGRYREDKKYAWYMHVFDAMRHLEKTPSINVRYLAIALANIQRDETSCIGGEPHEITSARHKNYKKFLTQSKITDLVARAVDFQENYEGLSSDELMETADSLIVMKNQMTKIFSGKSDRNYSDSQKPQMTSKQEKFLSLIDENIKAILKRAEDQALQKDNALEKITTLYRLYNANKDYYEGEGKRNTHLNEINKGENRLERLSKLSEDPSFWPEDAFEHVKAFVFAKNTFLDDKFLEDKLLNDLLDKVEILPPSRKKSDCLYTLLDKNLRAPYPETRERLFAIYTADVCAKLGKDDTSGSYQKKLSVYLKALEGGTEKDWDIGKRHGARDGLLSNVMSPADKYLLLRRLSDAIVSQEQTSQMAKEACAIKLDSDDMLRSYLYGIGVDYLTEEMDRNPEMANKFIQFFNSKGEQKDCAEISAYIETKAREKHSNYKEHLDKILKNTSPSNCKIFYENFWAAPLEARAVITARMLKGATHEESESVPNSGRQSWEPVFDLVIDNLIRPDDDSVDAKYARDIMRSYIKSRSDYERVLIMSAMMVANRNIGNDAGNIGKALKLFLENMGPAEIKLGQAISSHPDTPEKIKVELQKLKNAADVPARWTLYDWIKAENIPEEFWKDQYLGEIMGSASYYTTAALGEDNVLRILRPEGREKATKGFRVIRSTVDDLKEKEGSSDLSYGELTSSVQEMIIQAARMSDIETDHEIGQRQYEYAREIYNGVTIKSGTESFPLKVMDWSAKGRNWIVMDRAKGPTFNALPENTPEEITYKRQFAKGYIVFELQNILSGKKFDHDKHGAQLSIDPETNTVGIYDTGAMALHDPKSEEQKLLGNIVYGVLKDAMRGNETFSSLGLALGDKINDLHARGHDTQYLVEVKKGLLALGDFFKILTLEDIKGILPAIDLSKSTSKPVYQGITEGMSLFEKAQLQTLLTIKAVQADRDISIQRNTASVQSAVKVLNITAAPDTPDKARWLQETFRLRLR